MMMTTTSSDADARTREETGETRHLDQVKEQQEVKQEGDSRRQLTDDGRGHAQPANNKKSKKQSLEHSSSTRTKEVARTTTNVRKSRHHRPTDSLKKSRTSARVNNEPSLDQSHQRNNSGLASKSNQIKSNQIKSIRTPVFQIHWA
jgi:hypothetical protein